MVVEASGAASASDRRLDAGLRGALGPGHQPVDGRRRPSGASTGFPGSARDPRLAAALSRRQRAAQSGDTQWTTWALCCGLGCIRRPRGQPGRRRRPLAPRLPGAAASDWSSDSAAQRCRPSSSRQSGAGRRAGRQWQAATAAVDSRQRLSRRSAAPAPSPSRRRSTVPARRSWPRAGGRSCTGRGSRAASARARNVRVGAASWYGAASRCGDRDLGLRLLGQRDADRVAEAVVEQRADADRALDPAVLVVAGLGDAEMERERHADLVHPRPPAAGRPGS